MIRVRTLEVQKRESVERREGMTVEQALQAAGVEHYDPQNYTVTVNGETAELNAPAPDNALVVVTQKVSNG